MRAESLTLGPSSTTLASPPQRHRPIRAGRSSRATATLLVRADNPAAAARSGRAAPPRSQRARVGLRQCRRARAALRQCLGGRADRRQCQRAQVVRHRLRAARVAQLPDPAARPGAVARAAPVAARRLRQGRAVAAWPRTVVLEAAARRARVEPRASASHHQSVRAVAVAVWIIRGAVPAYGPA